MQYKVFCVARKYTEYDLQHQYQNLIWKFVEFSYLCLADMPGFNLGFVGASMAANKISIA